jgi:hypothetical protein
MAARRYRKAVELTLDLEQPYRLLGIITEMLELGPTKPAGADWLVNMRAETFGADHWAAA